MALDIANASYTPDLAQHVPGVANVAADALSRRYSTGKNSALPNYLDPSLETSVSDRPVSWWKTGPAKLNGRNKGTA